MTRQIAVGSTYTIGASVVTLVIGFARSVILARLLFPEDFGLFALAFFFVGLVERVQLFGFTAAFVHKHNYTQAEAAAHFLLHVSLSVLVLVLAVLITPLLSYFYPDLPGLGQVVVVITAVHIIYALNHTPRTILTKQLQFKRLAFLKVAGSLLALGITVLLAQNGAGVWALVTQDACFFIVELIGLWFYRRPWKPTFKTDWQTIKSYFQFGKFHLIATNITLLLDTFDDFWVGTFLGSNPLGFYSKAYEFARYPRGVVADPIGRVSFPIFARFQTDRYLLSRTFFQAASILVRVGFGLAGVFAFVAPEFIELFLGSKWMSMQHTFQLMIIYTLLDPLLLLIRQLFLANGQPKILATNQLWQMLFFVPAVIVFSKFWAIEGVALAADLMLLLGFILVLPALRQMVDFSLRQLISAPLFALILSWVGAELIIRWLPELHTAVTFMQKGLIMVVIYGGILLLLERKQIIDSTKTIKQLLRQ